MSFNLKVLARVCKTLALETLAALALWQIITHPPARSLSAFDTAKSDRQQVKAEAAAADAAIATRDVVVVACVYACVSLKIAFLPTTFYDWNRH